MASVEEIIADFVKGAQRAGACVQVQAPGTEQKLANSWGGFGGAIGAVAPQLSNRMPSGFIGSPAGAALGAGIEDQSLQSALGAGGGALLGQALGGGAGHAIAAALHQGRGGRELARVLGAAMGGGAGGELGQYLGRPDDPSTMDQIRSKLSAAHQAGAQAAAEHFKVAFAPLVAAGLSALAPAAARGLMGKVAPRALGAIAKPVAGALFDTGTQMAAQKALS